MLSKSLPMNLHSPRAPRRFRVYRALDTASGDPCAGIIFTPPTDSDALFFALKEAFPDGISHSNRIREALIEFLRNEQDCERQQNQPISSLYTNSSAEPTLESSSPSFVDNFDDQNGVGVKQNKSLHSVFSSASGLGQKPRWRRTMNEEERKDYRKRRARGACVGCKRKKRKCTHDEKLDGYEGDSEVAFSSPESTTSISKRVPPPEKSSNAICSETAANNTIEQATALLHRSYDQFHSSSAHDPPSSSQITQTYPLYCEVEESTASMPSVSIPPWPSLETLGCGFPEPFDFNYTSLGPTSLDLPLASSVSTSSSEYSTASVIPIFSQQEEQYAVDINFTSSARFFGSEKTPVNPISEDSTDFEDETYHSSEEADMFK